MNILKRTKTMLACLLSMTMLVSMSAFAISADEAEPAVDRYEAEDLVNEETGTGVSTLLGAAAVVSPETSPNTAIGTDVSGGAFVGSLGNGGGNLEIKVTVEEAGERNVDFYYITMDNRSIEVSVNGGDAVLIETPGNGNDWNGNVKVASGLLYLNAGENVINIGNGAAWAPNIDCIDIGPLDSEAKAAAVAALETEAAALPDEISGTGDVSAFESVANKYNGLTDEQKALLSDEGKANIEAAIAILDAYNESLDQSINDSLAADEVKALINAIGEVTADKEDAIKAARSAYDALTDAQKAYVTPGTLKTLTDAETALEALKNPSAGDNNANAGTSDTSDDTDDANGNYTTIIIIVVVAVVVVAGVVVVILTRKKK